MLAKQKKKEIDMLNGSLWDKILLYALPLAASSILQQLFNAADVAVVGQFAGSTALAAVGANGPIINLVVGMFVGLSVGTNAVIAVMIGKNEKDKIQKAVHTSMFVSVICGVILAVIGIVLARLVLELMSTPADILEQAVLYLQIYFIGMPFIMIYNFAAAILRAKGDTKRPLLSLSASGVINVLLNLAFVVVFHMGVEGVAIATLVSNVISSMLLVYFLMSEKGVLQLRLRELSVDGGILSKIAKIGIPAGLQGAVFAISNVCIQSALNSLGAAAIAATAAEINYEYVAYYIISSFGQAGVTFIGQNYGAGNWKRCIKIVRWCLLLGGIFTIIVNGTILLFSNTFAKLFTSDPAVIELAIMRMWYILAFELINTVIEILSRSMRGFGYSLVPAFVCMCGICGVRLIWLCTVYAQSPDFKTLLTVYPLSWTITALGLIIAFFIIKKHAKENMLMESEK